MHRLLALLTLSAAAFAQVGAECTPESMAAGRSGSIVTPGVGRWDCYAVNYGANPEPFSLALFALDFPELHMISESRVKDIVQVKQNRSFAGKSAKVITYLLIGAVLTTGSGLGKVPPVIVSRLAMGALGAKSVSDQLNKDIPPSAPFVSGLLTADQTLQPYGKPGFWITWTVYSSLLGPAGTKAIGPRMLSRPGAVQWTALPYLPPGTNVRFVAIPGTN